MTSLQCLHCQWVTANQITEISECILSCTLVTTITEGGRCNHIVSNIAQSVATKLAAFWLGGVLINNCVLISTVFGMLPYNNLELLTYPLFE